MKLSVEGDKTWAERSWMDGVASVKVVVEHEGPKIEGSEATVLVSS